jgi:hypothetical protein
MTRETRSSADKSSGIVAGAALPIGFLIAACFFLIDPFRVEIPIAPSRVVDASLLSIEPRRTPQQDPPSVLVGGVAENCSACHQIFRSASPARAVLSYHTDVRLRHGMNDRCINCHDVDDRERLTLRDGTTIPFAQTPLLCAQCHGTVFRDWQRGTHGKTLGSWVTESTPQRRLGCSECHDPHAPGFPPIAPLPGPNTLRMGDQDAHGGGRVSRSPLQQWMNESGAHP